MGFPKIGDPQNGRFISGKIPLKWMIARGTPMSGKPHMSLPQPQQIITTHVLVSWMVFFFKENPSKNGWLEGYPSGWKGGITSTSKWLQGWKLHAVSTTQSIQLRPKGQQVPITRLCERGWKMLYKWRSPKMGDPKKNSGILKWTNFEWSGIRGYLYFGESIDERFKRLKGTSSN